MNVRKFEIGDTDFDSVATVTAIVESWIYHKFDFQEKTEEACKNHITNHKWHGHLQFILLNILGQVRSYLMKIKNVEQDHVVVIIREILVKLDEEKNIVPGSPKQRVFSLQRIFVWSKKHNRLDESPFGKKFGSPDCQWSEMKHLYEFVLQDFVENDKEYVESVLKHFVDNVMRKKGNEKKTHNTSKAETLNWHTAYESGFLWVKSIIMVCMCLFFCWGD